MEKFKTYGSLFILLSFAFIIGSYATVTIFNVKEVEPHQWGIAIIFEIYYTFEFINRIRKCY